jgi:UDP-2,3-diacylglucosamine pyrophosphatase LpxH
LAEIVEKIGTVSKRKPKVVVISDVHLGTYGCQAQALLDYLRSVKPETLIINGDFIDIWQFRTSYFPPEHLQIVNRVLKLLANGTNVYYLTGNHDDALRRFSDFTNGKFQLCDELILELGGKKHWFFHGDRFDISVKKTRWLAKIGGFAYEILILLNRAYNRVTRIWRGRPSNFAHTIKAKVKGMVKKMDDFEAKAIKVGAAAGYDVVVCGHVHRPQMREAEGVLYLNSGDWIDSLTALEFENDAWQLYRHQIT